MMSERDEKIENDAESAEDACSELVLAGNVGIADVEEMHQKLNDMLTEHKEVVIQAADLNRVDAAALQLLYAFVKETKKQDIPVNWQSTSDELRQSAATLSLAEGMGFS